MKFPSTRPPLKWAGGKQRLLTTLLQHIPSKGRLIEPFVGAGSVFLAAGERDLVINDANPDLIGMYQALQRSADSFVDAAQPYFTDSFHSQSAYLEVRARFNQTKDIGQRALMLLYLNRFGFNGLYRVNKSGGFNTPYGHPQSLPRFPEAELKRLATRLQGAQIMCGDFAAATQLAREGDVLYCDPPYSDTTGGSTSFVGYVADVFRHADHERLVDQTWQAVGRGATVVISNHDTPATRALCAGMRIEPVEVRRTIAASAHKRGSASELIAIAAP